MRLLWSTDNLDQIKKFSNYLTTNGIEHTLEGATNSDWGSDAYGNKIAHIWIHNEDQVKAAENYLKEFQEDPSKADFTTVHAVNLFENETTISQKFIENKTHTRIHEIPGPPLFRMKNGSQTGFKLTNFLTLLCSILLLMDLWNAKNQKEIPTTVRPLLLTTSPVQKSLLYDYPKTYELIDRIVSLYGYQALTNPQDLPPPGKFLFVEHLKYLRWHGAYPILIAYIQNESSLTQVKAKVSETSSPILFEKIRQGEVWRLISPILLHGDILHLFFNMIWLLLLGSQIENRVGLIKYLSLILIIAAISNTAQYLMTGPAFIGFSGVVCGMAFFIRARQQLASWEGYHLASSTFHFIVFFIGILAFLSFITFFLDTFQNFTFPISIANTAHIVGASVGWLLGRSSFFSWSKEVS